jgi:hypothetical protein
LSGLIFESTTPITNQSILMKRCCGIIVGFLICLHSAAQQKKPPQQKSPPQQKATDAAGINLENINYPFPVKFLSTSSQWQPLRMAYMDEQPDIPNGKTVLLLHGKNFNGAYWENTAKELTNCIQKDKFNPPLFELKIMAKSIRTAVSVSIVPPTVIATASFFEIPNLLTMGYETMVWVENILEISRLAVML